MMNMYDEYKFPASWLPLVKDKKTTTLFEEIMNTIEVDKATDYIVFPQEADYFKALQLCEFSNCKVVIIGQDPYHGDGEANGIAFSVNHSIVVPPSLKNIFKELHQDLQIPMPKHGDLSNWCRQGVLLLNSSLTVVKDNPASHAKIGWHDFTNKLIGELSSRKKHLVFLLWGKHAEQKKTFIDDKKHLVLVSSHPSPLSVRHGFEGCGHFSKTNTWLTEKKLQSISWLLD
jgi:uracil-DNA glycosylase